MILYSCEKSEPVNPTVYINESNFSFGFSGFSWDSTNDDYYHSKYCEKLSENYITMTLAEARQEGYTQCPNCITNIKHRSEIIKFIIRKDSNMDMQRIIKNVNYYAKIAKERALTEEELVEKIKV